MINMGKRFMIFIELSRIMRQCPQAPELFCFLKVYKGIVIIAANISDGELCNNSKRLKADKYF